MKLAIVKSQKDLLRVIPLLRGSFIEFKISTLGSNYSIEYWHQGIHNPELYTTSSEITYHGSSKKSGKTLPGLIHVKEVDQISGIVNYKYRFPKVADILMDSEFPMPLFKLTIAKNVDKIYTRKVDHFVFDFDSPEITPSNVLEIYIVSKHFDYNRFSNKWPNIYELWEATSIDYVIKGVYLSQYFLNMFKSGKPIMRCGYAFKNFHLIFKFYEDENVETNRICFYENYDYISMLGTTPVQLIDDKTKWPLSKINPAFYYDLNRQIKGGISKEEYELWNNFFNVSYEHISKLDIKRFGFLVPQI